jgi:hypothetical protein
MIEILIAVLAICVIGFGVVVLYRSWKLPQEIDSPTRRGTTANQIWLDETPEPDTDKPSLLPSYRVPSVADRPGDVAEAAASQADAQEALPEDDIREGSEELTRTNSLRGILPARKKRGGSNRGDRLPHWYRRTEWRHVLLAAVGVWVSLLIGLKAADAKIHWNHKWPWAEAPAAPIKPHAKHLNTAKAKRAYRTKLRSYRRKLRHYHQSLRKLRRNTIPGWIVAVIAPFTVPLLLFIGWALDSHLDRQQKRTERLKRQERASG